MLDPITLLIVVVVGLAAGVVGGLAGIGGSIIMLPALGLILAYEPGNGGREHHLYMAAAMVVNAVVSLAAVKRHLKARAVRKDLWVWLLPGMSVGILGGVELARVGGGPAARLGLALFLIAYCVYNALTAWKGKPESEARRERGGRIVPLVAGLIVGNIAGFLGIGGGIVLVPVLALVVGAPTRQAIATSASVMAVTSIFGAAYKIYSLGAPEIMQSRWEAVLLAIPMSIGAVIGAPLGATLTHTLKLPHLKLAISAVLAVAGVRLAMSGLERDGAVQGEVGSVSSPEPG